MDGGKTSPGTAGGVGSRWRRPGGPSWLVRVTVYAGAAAAVVAATAGLRWAGPDVNAAEAALVYVLVTLAAATWAGLGPAVVAAVASTLMFNYAFLPPVGTLQVAEPADWFALVALLITASTASHLVATARRRSDEAARRTEEALRLYEFGRSLLTVTDPAAAGQQILAAAATSLGAEACCFVHWTAGGVQVEPPAAAAAVADRAVTDQLGPRPATVSTRVGPHKDLLLLPLPRAAAPQALLARYGSAAVVPASATLAALASLVALALERVELLQQSLDAAVLRESEAVKSALLTGVSHNLRTPLAALRVAATALQDPATWAAADTRTELLASLDEAAASMNAAVGNVLYLSQVEADRLHLDRRRHDVASVLSAAIEQVGPRRLGRRLQVDIAPATPAVEGDLGMLATAVANLLDNAVKYSPPEGPIEVVAATADSDQVRITVADRGSGYAAADEPRLFTPFGRGPRRSRTGGGLGLGLSIAKALVEAHGGTVRLAQRAGGGTAATLTLPASPGRATGADHA